MKTEKQTGEERDRVETGISRTEGDRRREAERKSIRK